MKNQFKTLKQLLTVFFIVNFLLLTANCFSQGTAINTTGAAADNSAILDVSSNNKGVLIPRVSEAERLGIFSPARGLMVYQIGNDEGFWYFDGIAWQQFGDNLGNHTATDSLNMTNNKVVNVATCTQNLDAANKEYVDNAVSAGGGGSSMPSMISNESATAYTYSEAVQYCDNLVENTYNDWRMPDAYEIQYFAGLPGASSNYLWTKTHTPIDYQANQNFVSVKLDDGRWRNGDEMLSPVFSEVAGYAGAGNPTMTYITSATPNTSGNWLKITDINLQVRYGYGRLKFNFPNGTSTYSPTGGTTSSSYATTMDWSNIQMPILVTSIDLEGYSYSTYNMRGILKITGFEIAPLQKEGATLYTRCVR